MSHSFRVSRHRMVLLLATCLFAISHFSATFAEALQDNPTTSQQAEPRQPITFKISGTVRGPDGELLANQEVMLVGCGIDPAYTRYPFTVLGDVSLDTTKTDQEGKFDFSVASDQEGVLPRTTMNLGQWPMIVVAKPGHGIRAVSMNVPRMLTDLPVEIQLQSMPTRRLKVIDAVGNPIANALVCPGKADDHWLHYSFAKRLGVQTDENGECELGTLDQQSNIFFVHSPSLGYQCLQAVRGDDSEGFRLYAIETAEVRGKFEVPDRSDLELIAGRPVLIDSRQTTAYARDSFAPFGWADSTVQPDGSFAISHVATGNAFPSLVLPNEVPLKPAIDFDSFALTVADSAHDLTIDLERARYQDAQAVNGQGEPIAGIYLNSTRVDSAGRAKLKYVDSFQIFGYDPVQEYRIPSDFGTIVEKFTVGETVKVPMLRAIVVTGKVFDQAGQPVAGAQVKSTSSGGRFQETLEALSDRDGKFTMRGLHPEKTYRFSAASGLLASVDDPAMQITRDAVPDSLIIRLQPAKSYSIRGKVVDQAGKPAAGISVMLRKPMLLQEENYGAADYRFLPQGPAPTKAVTDEQGNFHFSQSPDFAGRWQIAIDNNQFLPFKSSLVDGERMGGDNNEILLPALQLYRRPSLVDCEISVLDQQTGDAMDGAVVVLLGSLSGKNQGKTNTKGNLKLQLPQAPQLVAVRADGYPIQFRWLENVGSRLEFQLSQQEPEKQSQVWFNRSAQDYFNATEALFEELEQPPVESTYHRRSMYLTALIHAFPRRAIEWFESDSQQEDITTMALYDFDNFRRLHAADRNALRQVVSQNAEDDFSSWSKATFALLSSEASVKEELYGEAFLDLQNAKQETKLINTGLLAQALILDDRLDVARAAVADTWASADELKAILAAGKPELKTGVSRRFLPFLALVDPAAAMELCPLIARDVEAESIRYEILTLWSLAEPDSFQQQVVGQVTDAPTGLTLDPLRFALQIKDDCPDSLAAWPAEHAKWFPPGQAEIKVRLMALGSADSNQQREQALEALVNAIANAPGGDQEFYWSDIAVPISDWCSRHEVSPQELDQILFALLASRPVRFETNGALEMLGIYSRLLAMKDPELARQLMEPVFREPSWLFTYQTNFDFQQSRVLQSAAWIDPDWSVEIARSLADRSQWDSPLRRMELYSGLIKELSKLGSDRE